ncbi:unannotated protein [freshwater metagenome]|uniref:Unannotated protein n=1 Tax=freshwater metagenome TaxID=449393 RepID=A0A6J7D3B3_9ZZZZ|nr:DUF1638 domain-containing protein [Actinomycetota bacterium]
MVHQAQRPLVVACAALTADLRAVLAADGLAGVVDVHYLPANLHNTPQRIVGELRPIVEQAHAAERPVFVAYADCGTGGLLDAFLAEYPGVGRLPGAHCYEFFAGSQVFAALQEQELGTFYLTDFLAKHFDALVWNGLGLDRAPQLRDMYFGHYTRLVHLAQADDAAAHGAAVNAAERLGLAFEHRFVGRQGLAAPISEWSLTIRKAAA